MLPLEGVRILALEQFGAGPFGTVHLADLGAEVIKIEDPRGGGDVGRYVPPFQRAESSLFFETFNRNKRSLCLDLAVSAGRQVFDDLVRRSDVVFSNLRGDVPERLAIRYDDLKNVNPRIVCCSLSGFGMTGSHHRHPAYDSMLQASAGWMSLTGEPDMPPTKAGLSLVDFSAGYAAAVALLAGLHAAQRDGVGMDCDVSLYDTALNMLTYQATWHLTGGYKPERLTRSAHPSIVPFQSFPTADGWIVIACPKDKFFRRLAEAIGRPDLRDDDRFADFAARLKNRIELVEVLDQVLVRRTTREWLDTLVEAGVPCAPVRSVEEALQDPFLVERGLLVETSSDGFGTVRSIGSPVRVGTARKEHRRAPRLNEDEDYVLRDLLGYEPQRMAELRASGIVGRPAA